LAKLALPPPQPTDVPDKEHIAFKIEHNGKRITAFVKYLLLWEIDIDRVPHLDLFFKNKDKLVAAAAAKFDAGKVDDEGYVRLNSGDLPQWKHEIEN
jgi:hypothetical protein